MTPEENTHRRDQFQREADAWEWLQANMPNEVKAALAKFVEINPHYKGAEWWDVLSIMSESDSHLDIIEPMIDASDEDWEWTILHTFVTLTLIYSSRMFMSEWATPSQRIDVVRATIANNGGA